MKKIKWGVVILVLAVLAIFFVPVKQGPYDDGGSVAYAALTYKVVNWHTSGYPALDATRLYLFPDNFKSLSELSRIERKNIGNYWQEPLIGFQATVIELTDTTALVEPQEGEYERQSCDRFIINIKDLDPIDVQVGSVVRIRYTGEILESYPAQIHVKSWELVESAQPRE